MLGADRHPAVEHHNAYGFVNQKNSRNFEYENFGDGNCPTGFVKDAESFGARGMKVEPERA